MSVDITTTKRNLKIKTGAAKRLLKEHINYQNEVTELRLKADKLRADGADGWDIRSADRLVLESEKMATDTRDRLGKTVGELRDLTVEARKHKVPELEESVELVEAEDILEEANA